MHHTLEKDKSFRKSIDPDQRLAVTLRLDSCRRNFVCINSDIDHHSSDAIYQVLNRDYLKVIKNKFKLFFES